MYIVKWTNIITGRSGSFERETEAEALAHLQKHQNNETYGRNARQAVKETDQYDPSLVLSEFPDTDEDGNPRTILSLKAEYEFEGPVLIDGSGITPEDKAFRMKVAKEKAAQFKIFKDFGETVELYFTALINERNYTQVQKDAVQENADVLAVLGQLKFGRVARAKGMIDAIVADEDLFFEDDLNAISLLMADFLEKYPLQE